ncbi:unnamed protein product [Phaeothamnion confervicola]
MALCDEAGVFRRPLGLAGVWGGLVRRWLDDLLPPDADAACRGRVHLILLRLAAAPPVVMMEAATAAGGAAAAAGEEAGESADSAASAGPAGSAAGLTLPRLALRRPRRVVVADFASRYEVIEACMASVHVPFFMDGRFAARFRGRRCLDGSFRAGTTALSLGPGRPTVRLHHSHDSSGGGDSGDTCRGGTRRCGSDGSGDATGGSSGGGIDSNSGGAGHGRRDDGGFLALRDRAGVEALMARGYEHAQTLRREGALAALPVLRLRGGFAPSWRPAPATAAMMAAEAVEGRFADGSAATDATMVAAA